MTRLRGGVVSFIDCHDRKVSPRLSALVPTIHVRISLLPGVPHLSICKSYKVSRLRGSVITEAW